MRPERRTPVADGTPDRSSGGGRLCPVTGKQVLTREVARDRAKNRRRKYHERVAEYFCRHCSGWHIGHRFRLRGSA